MIKGKKHSQWPFQVPKLPSKGSWNFLWHGSLEATDQRGWACQLNKLWKSLGPGALTNAYHFAAGCPIKLDDLPWVYLLKRMMFHGKLLMYQTVSPELWSIVLSDFPIGCYSKRLGFSPHVPQDSESWVTRAPRSNGTSWRVPAAAESIIVIVSFYPIHRILSHVWYIGAVIC